MARETHLPRNRDKRNFFMLGSKPQKSTISFLKLEFEKTPLTVANSL